MTTIADLNPRETRTLRIRKPDRFILRGSWTLAGTIFGAAIGIGLFTEPSSSWRAVAPWIAAAWLLGWVGLLVPASRRDGKASLSSLVMAVGLSILPLLLAAYLADWWFPADPNRQPDRAPILVLWALCGAIGGFLAGMGAGLVQARSYSGVRRLAIATLQATLWAVTLAFIGLVFLPLGYQAVSAVYRLPVPALHHYSTGWILSGTVVGLLLGIVGDWIRRVGVPQG
jgi:hypothetical protein